jgi:hypothetical protein
MSAELQDVILVCSDSWTASGRASNKTCKTPICKRGTFCTAHQDQIDRNRKNSNKRKSIPKVARTTPRHPNCHVGQCVILPDCGALKVLLLRDIASSKKYGKLKSINGGRSELYREDFSEELHTMVQSCITEAAEWVCNLKDNKVAFNPPDNISFVYHAEGVHGMQYPHIDLRPEEFQVLILFQDKVESTLVSTLPRGYLHLSNDQQICILLGTSQSLPHQIKQDVDDYKEVLLHTGSVLLHPACPTDQVTPGTMVAFEGGIVHAGPASRQERFGLFFTLTPSSTSFSGDRRYDRDTQISRLTLLHHMSQMAVGSEGTVGSSQSDIRTPAMKQTLSEELFAAAERCVQGYVEMALAGHDASPWSMFQNADLRKHFQGLYQQEMKKAKKRSHFTAT